VPIPPIPVDRELTGDPDLAAPAGFTLVDEPLVDGLPHRVALGSDFTAVLAVPSGLALTWRDADPIEPVTSSGTGLLPVAGVLVDSPDVGELLARLFIIRDDAVLGALPLVLGLRARVPDDGVGESGVQLELIVMSWEIRAGSMRGPGDFGARFSFAWRRLMPAPDLFTTAPVHPRVRARGALTTAGGLS
jgi:hypothetical protein